VTSATSWSAARGNLLLAAASLLVGLLSLEAAARLLLRRGGQVSEAETRRGLLEHDPLLGWRKRPGARVTYRRPEYVVEVAVNREGLRDPERSPAAPPGVLRILALGDSFVEGYSVPLPATVTQVMEAELREQGCRAEVVNGATQGYSTDQEYLFYRSLGVRYSARIVVLFFYYNDVWYNTRDVSFGQPKPLLLPLDGTLVPRLDPVPATPAQPPPSDGSGATASQGGRSVLLEWTRERLMQGAPRAHDALAALGLWPAIAAAPPFPELGVFRDPPSPEIKGAWDATARILEALEREARGQGARLLLAYVPSRMEVRDSDWELTRRRYRLGQGRWNPGAAAARLAQISGEAGIPLVDLTPALRRVERGIFGGPYYREDLHWNRTGHRVAAQELVAFLRNQRWAPECGG
jgi:lysophospholipase L1-like esterase